MASRKVTTEFTLSKAMIPNRQTTEIRDFFLDEEGATAIEYAVMLALIVAVVIGAVAMLTQSTKQSLETSADAISSAMGN